jgi:class 3 adenylate cyclase
MSKPQILQKKLKAIVFTDMADFTTISAQDEQKALDLIQKQNEIIKPIVEKHNGEWLKEIGDGLLFSFDSSLEAVRCSIQIQETLKDIDDLNIRIGIHQGDIFIKDGDVFGDDVNIASRVEGFSPIGGISISDKVHKDISGVSDIKTSFLGHRKLKGVEQETKLRCIVSNELPNSTSAFNSFIYSISGFLIFWGIAEILNSIYDLFQLKSNNLCGELTGIITYLLIGVLCILAGYNNYSYIKGVSNRAQMNFIIFSIAIILLAVFNVIMGYNCCNDCP